MKIITAIISIYMKIFQKVFHRKYDVITSKDCEITYFADFKLPSFRKQKANIGNSFISKLAELKSHHQCHTVMIFEIIKSNCSRILKSSNSYFCKYQGNSTNVFLY